MYTSEEGWLEVFNASRYMVHYGGAVRDMLKERLVKVGQNSTGTVRVYLVNDMGVGAYHSLNHLVASTFLADYVPGECRVRYRDGNPWNNHINNLEVVPHKISYHSDQPRYVPKFRRGRGGRVRIVETGEIFDSVGDVADVLVGYPSNIYACLRGKTESYLGYHFEYVE